MNIPFFEDRDALGRHSLMTLNSFQTVLSMLKASGFDQDENFMINNNKRKVDVLECLDQCKSEEISGGSCLSKEKRGCYKRR